MKALFTSLLLLISVCVKAQFSGAVIDERQQPIPGAIVKPDGQAAKITDQNGQFYFTKPAAFVVISFAGYCTDTISPLKTGMLIKLQPYVKVLDEVKIKGQAPIIRQQADRTVIAINEQVKKLADNALEVIALAPGIDISPQENAISMSGKKNIQVMINDKPVQMTMTDLVKYLKSLPTGSLKSVELMKEPPARYETDGQTGIINVRTAPLKGITGNVDANTSQSRYNWSDISGVLNYGTEKLAISSYLAWHRGGYFVRSNRDRFLQDGILNQQTNNLERWSDPVIRLAADYQIAKGHVIGAIFEREASTNTTTYQTVSITDPGFSELTNGREPYMRHWDTYNLNYQHNDVLNIDLDKAYFNRDGNTAIMNQGAADVNYQRYNTIDITTLKADAMRQFSKLLKIETGAKLANIKSSQQLNDDKFSYRENIYAAYTGLGYNANKWSWQVGLRAELTDALGIAKGSNQQSVTAPDSTYFNLLPSLFINYSASQRHQFRLAISRRMQRPDYSDLAPFTYQINPLDYQAGNPYLRTQRNDAAEFSYIYDDRISAVAAYRQSADYFNPVVIQTGNILTQTTGNAGRVSSFSFDLNYPLRINKWWNMLNKVNVANDHFRGQLFQGMLDAEQWRWSVFSSQRITLPKQFLFQVTGRYNSAHRDLIYQQAGSGTVSASLGKKFKGDKVSVRLGMSDIFNTTRNFTRVNFGTLNYTENQVVESRRVSLAFNWRFGNQKVRQTQDHSNGDSDEKGRSN
ncbi:outer membrane beta-barrel family protein [Mucilaginibacter sp. KACC 22063]|uniref:outer membrane beta-barrel family protein n=1 Tax=Mucilaginibacter sp. KACC 22063 TaxID=3025666 RepID=UPI002364FD45|nr:outer membrane beta-barrel family protein [Mucilaginibacter sp. KACC 22063]WDF56115.1 outer membrane beta-barrel family protein [Mucilaginibacter sp. KACC 22063]